MSLTWAPIPCTNYANGWRGQYYSGTSWSGTVRCRNDATINFNWGLLSAPISGIGLDLYSVEWNRRVTFAGGWYRFRAQVDDGLRFFVDGEQIASVDTGGTYTTDVLLTPGQHLITVRYYESLLSAKMIFDWAPVARYVRVQQPIAEYLHMAEVQVNGYNTSGALALRSQGRTATQSSNYNGVALAAKAVDGNTTGSLASNSVSHTTNAMNSWWQVDLAATYGVDNVKIFNRTDCCGTRLLNAQVFLSATDMSSMTYAQIMADPTIVKTTVGALAGTRPEWQQTFRATT